MLILLFVLCVIVVVVGIIIDDIDFSPGLTVVGGIGLLIIMIVSLVLAIELSLTTVVDEKLNMYVEENTKIETQISEIVSNYMTFEKDTFIELKNESAITLVSLYPELKSDELVKTQIATYQENNSKIKSLKETKINKSVYKWWLYFGK